VKQAIAAIEQQLTEKTNRLAKPQLTLSEYTAWLNTPADIACDAAKQAIADYTGATKRLSATLRSADNYLGSYDLLTKGLS
jgi:hypothetical protein